MRVVEQFSVLYSYLKPANKSCVSCKSSFAILIVKLFGRFECIFLMKCTSFFIYSPTHFESNLMAQTNNVQNKNGTPP
jgi:hypothetical protein